jgi:AAA+ superfamily predicted ATPase
MPIPYKIITFKLRDDNEEIKEEKTYKLRFGMGATMEFKELTGMSLSELGNNVSEQVLGQVLWVMLKQENQNLTQKDVNKLIDEGFDGTMDDLMDLTQEAIQAAYPPKNPTKPTATKKS